MILDNANFVWKKKILEEALNLGLSEDFKLEQWYNKDNNNTCTMSQINLKKHENIFPVTCFCVII